MEETIKELKEIHLRLKELSHTEFNRKLPISVDEAIQLLKPWVQVVKALEELTFHLMEEKQKTGWKVETKPEHVIPNKNLKSL